MANASTTSLVDALRQYRLLEAVQLEEAKSLQAHFSEPKALAGELIRRGWLTPYQANQLLQGKGQELLLGSYVLLERLGEGGMGQVFKARNWKLGRVVALKLIRKERLDNPDAIRRFEREVRSAAALSHPNIVHALDADQVGGTHLLVMEYVEGTDLAKLVKKNGPLPVPQACEYIRQAALGLQHAFQRGMVHRDIKPANLLLTANGSVVKVLDMGLARLDQPGTDDDKSSTMTQEGAVMGTPDYIAPEQARQSHTVDIRADIYSLGCTFYFLLTGRVPFPGGSLTEKLLHHQLDEPKPLEQFRPELPPGVAAVLRKMMAKRPEDRFQAPAEVAAAIASVFGTGNGTFQTASVDDRTIGEGGRAVARAETSNHTLDSALDYMAQRGDAEAADSPQRLARKAEERRLMLSIVAVGSVVLVVLAVVLFVAQKEPARKKPPVNEEGSPVVVNTPAKAKVDQAWLNKVAAMPAEKQVEAVIAKLKDLNSGFDGKVTHKVEGGVVTELRFLTDNVTDISPVRALLGLRRLFVDGSGDWQHRNGKLSDFSPLKDMKLTSLSCNFTKVLDLSPLIDMMLTSFLCHATQVSNLTPLKNMKLTQLDCGYTQVSDLSPLKNMKLTEFHCQHTAVSDLSPLKDMTLTSLSCNYTKVSDLSPLKDMKLSTLRCHVTPVSDLTPLKDTKLTSLSCQSTKVSDLSPLKGMPLKELWCDFKPERDAEILRSIKTLEKINGKPAKEFWSEVDEMQAAFAAWCKEVAAMPAEKQVEAVAAKMKELNPGFEGKVELKKVEAGVVTEIGFSAAQVTDISPMRTLAGLKVFRCGWRKTLSDLSPLKDMKLTTLEINNTSVSDLSPLKNMKLTFLHCGGTLVSDLSPLKDMKLTFLHCGVTLVSDLSPLKDMKLTELYCGGTLVSDLSPLKDMKLTFLDCSWMPVSDLSPLKDMKLTFLHCGGSKVTDLSPLKGMPLKELSCNFKPERDTEILRSFKTLEKINLKPAKEFWKEVDDKKP